MRNDRLNTPRIKSNDTKPLIEVSEPVKCPFCSYTAKNGPQLNKHVHKIHWQV